MVKKLFFTFLYWQLYQKRSFYLLRISGQNFSPKWKTDNWNFSYLSKKYKIECCIQIIQGLSFNRNCDYFGLKIKSQNTWTQKWFINLSATLAMMSALVKRSIIFLFVIMNILGNEYFLKRIWNIPKKMLLLLESIVTTMVIQLIHLLFH